MAELRNVGLAAALLAASGGLAYATWGYVSRRRRADTPEPGQAEDRESPMEKETETETETVERSNLCVAPALQQEMPRQCKQVLVLGLDGSGKTSVLNSILTNRGKHSTTPTEGINAMCINTGRSRMELIEVGGGETLRPYWKMYLPRALAVIFVVDSADHSRLPLAKSHLHQLIQQDSYLPLLVLANKQDLENAYHITEIHEALALSEICRDRKLFLIGTHVTMEGSEISSGIEDTREFLTQLISESAATA